MAGSIGRGGLLLTLCVVAVACGDSDLKPTPPAPTPPSGGPTVYRIRIDGQTSLAAIGDSTQFVATASYSDGTDKVVTDTALWSSDESSVATVRTGTVVARDLGWATITAAMSGVKASARVTVTPPGTFVATGRVREPGSGNLAKVQVTEVSTGLSRMSRDGDFMIGGLTTGDLRFTKPGYEDADVQVRAATADTPDVPMQKVIYLQAGSTVTPMVTPNDVTYEVTPGVRCHTCKRIRLASPAAGLVDLTLTWTAMSSQLSLWAEGREYSAVPGSPLRVNATVAAVNGEVFVYVGDGVAFTSYAGNHLPFTLAASGVR